MKLLWLNCEIEEVRLINMLFDRNQVVDSKTGPGENLAKALWHSGDTANEVGDKNLVHR